ncbi:MAG: 50S ribosomal protein L6 [Candidatus Zixiibacteriota bacterium]
MSRIGKQPVPIPDKTKVDINGFMVTVTGPKGSTSYEFRPGISVEVVEKEIVVKRNSDMKRFRALHGLTRALLNNMIIGVNKGFKKELSIIGVGFRAEVRGKIMAMNLGYSHPIIFRPPEGIHISVEPKENRITITGIDKQLVGQVAAKIRSFRVPEPYKGKGIRYIDEHVRHKAGKTAGAGATTGAGA